MQLTHHVNEVLLYLGLSRQLVEWRHNYCARFVLRCAARIGVSTTVASASNWFVAIRKRRDNIRNLQ